MATYMNPFDLQNLFVSTFAGDWTVFIFIAVIVIAMGSGFFRMNDKIFAIMLVLFTIIMSPYMGGIYLIAMLLVGLISFYSIARIVKQ